MILTLEVTGPQAQEMGGGARKVFKAVGGTIGRLPDNDWVFPDPYVSGRHALIRYVNEKFFVEDTSTNGVFINSPDNRLKRGQPQALRDGDLLFIDAYRINVSIQKDPAAESRRDPFSGLKQDKTAGLVVLGSSDNRHGTVMHDSTVVMEEDEDEESQDHVTEWFGGAEMADAKKNLPRSRPEIVKPTLAVPPPARRSPPPVIKAVASTPAPARARTEQGSISAGEAQMQALLGAAGIEGLDPSTETARTLGEILRIALGGVMETLRARERMKDGLRMRGTSFKEADNNPLKFSANVDDAFHNLLVKENPAYLQPVEAFEEAFRDLRDHQAAFQAAMRLAFESMLSQLDPERMQEEFDRQMKGAIIGVPAKLRYWDLYRDKYSAVVKDAEAGFRTLFGEAFARAYEEHLERLKKSSRQSGQ